MSTVEESNAALREAVAARLSAAALKAEQPSENYSEWQPAFQSKEPKRREYPGSLAFMEVIEEIRQTHLRKSQDYGDPVDPLANVRAGAELVGIEAWRGCLVRMADKMQRIRSFCREGSLANEGFEDALLDLASYAVITLVLFREQS